MNDSEKRHQLARKVAEWNNVSVGDPEATCKTAKEVCYLFTKLYPRTFIKEWQKLIEEEVKA